MEAGPVCRALPWNPLRASLPPADDTNSWVPTIPACQKACCLTYVTDSCQPWRVLGPNAEQARNGAHIISIWSVVAIELRFGEDVRIRRLRYVKLPPWPMTVRDAGIAVVVPAGAEVPIRRA